MRPEWRLAKVVRLFAGADALQRVAEVTMEGQSVIVRTVRLLIPWKSTKAEPEEHLFDSFFVCVYTFFHIL